MISICITKITEKKNISIVKKKNQGVTFNTFLNNCSIWQNEKKIKWVSDWFFLILCHYQLLSQMLSEENYLSSKKCLLIEGQNFTSMGISEVEKKIKNKKQKSE